MRVRAALHRRARLAGARGPRSGGHLDRHQRIERRDDAGVQPTTHTCVSLRAAIAASEATKDVADVINVPAGTININNDLVIQSDITIIGASARTNIIDGGAKYRGFRVTSTGSAKLNHLTIRNGAGRPGRVHRRRRHPQRQRRRRSSTTCGSRRAAAADGAAAASRTSQGTLTMASTA